MLSENPEEDVRNELALLGAVRSVIEVCSKRRIEVHRCMEIVLYDMMSALALKFIQNGNKGSDFVHFVEGVMKDCWKIAKERENGSVT